MILTRPGFLPLSCWTSVRGVTQIVVWVVAWTVAWALWLALVFLYLDYRAERVERSSNSANNSVNNSVNVKVSTNARKISADVKSVIMTGNLKMISLPLPPLPPPVLSIRTEHVKQSRLWLAKLEQGDGPNIVFTWPDDANEREWIQQRLYNCGVRLGKWRNGRLRAIEAGSETVSGFIRVFNGEMSHSEQRRLQLLAGDGLPVRLFPRSLDIYLLSQLSNVTLGRFMHAKKVSAHYEKHINGVNIRNIQVDGKRFERSVEFLPENGQCS